MKKTAVTLMLCFTPVLSNAQEGSFINFGKDSSGRTLHVGSGTNAQRIGKAVLTFVHVVAADTTMGGWSYQLLMACDGSWLTGGFNFSYVPKGLSLDYYESEARANIQNMSPEKQEFRTWADTEIQSAENLKRHVTALCKGASQEPRNFPLGVSLYSPEGAFPGGLGSILTGTMSRRGKEIDVWTRTDEYTLEPIMFDGKPWLFNGVAQTRQVFTGSYSLVRTAYQCNDRRLGRYQFLTYKKGQPTPTSVSIARERLQLDDVVPGSVGEVELEAVCKLYGN
jgi:hypothetical protein